MQEEEKDGRRVEFVLNAGGLRARARKRGNGRIRRLWVGVRYPVNIVWSM
jgi:hypothetical protein